MSNNAKEVCFNNKNYGYFSQEKYSFSPKEHIDLYLGDSILNS